MLAMGIRDDAERIHDVLNDYGAGTESPPRLHGFLSRLVKTLNPLAAGTQIRNISVRMAS